MLKPKSPQESFYGSYLYDRIVPVDHLLRKINQVVDFSFAGQILQDRYHPDIGRPAEDPDLEIALSTLAQQERVLIEEWPEVKAVYLTPLHVAEANVARRLKFLIEAPKQSLQIDVEKAIQWVQGTNHI
jgi:hypothetical protein